MSDIAFPRVSFAALNKAQYRWPRLHHRPGLPAALAACAGMLTAVSSVGAQQCPAALPGTVVAACITEFRQLGLTRRLAADPAPGRSDSRLDDKPWIAADWAVAPFAVVPDTAATTMRASLLHFGAYADLMTARRIEEAKALAPAGLPVPKLSGSRKAPVDVWSRIDVSNTDAGTAHSSHSAVGADVKLSRRSLLGVAFEQGDRTVAQSAMLQDDYALSAYFALKPSPMLSFDAKAQWAETNGALAGQSFTASQSVLSARIRGDWSLMSLRFSPVLEIAHAVDEAQAGASSIDKSTISLAPRLSRSFKLDDGEKLEPFVTYKRNLDIGSRTAGADLNAGRTAGAGLSLVKPDAYSLSLSTDVDGIGSGDRQTTRSRLQLKVPLK